MKIYIIRHGETALNVRGVLQGQLDEPLNENGRTLAELTGRGMRGIHFDACVSSPLSRAVETAELVLNESGNDIPIRIDDRLIEMDFGDMDARKISEMGEESLSFFLEPFAFPGFPNGESIPELCRRTQPFLKELIALDDGKNCSLTIVEAEGGVARITEIDRVFYDPKLIVDHSAAAME